MSTYEKWALGLSIVAILIPFFQWAWKKFIVKPVLKHYTTGNARLFINRSGSYMSLESVYEAVNKPISIKKIYLYLTRVKDGKRLNLEWSMFTSPINLQFVGNYSSSSEIAHPFRIDANQVSCTFTEFASLHNAAWKRTQPLYDALINEVNSILPLNAPYSEVYSKYIVCDAYKKAKEEFSSLFFWKPGNYRFKLTAVHEKRNTSFFYSFRIKKEEYEVLKNNLNEVLLYPLKNAYKIPSNIQTVTVETIEDK